MLIAADVSCTTIHTIDDTYFVLLTVLIGTWYVYAYVCACVYVRACLCVRPYSRVVVCVSARARACVYMCVPHVRARGCVSVFSHDHESLTRLARMFSRLVASVCM